MTLWNLNIYLDLPLLLCGHFSATRWAPYQIINGIIYPFKYVEKPQSQIYFGPVIGAP